MKHAHSWTACRTFAAASFAFLVAWTPGVVTYAEDVVAKPAEKPRPLLAPNLRGLGWLTKHQGVDGAWGGTYSIAINSFASLAYLSASDEPFTGPNATALLRALRYLLAKQEEGLFPKEGHTWIHGQGFAALALSEAYGQSLRCKTKPDMDMKAVREVVSKAVTIVAKSQSTSGGWWYTQGEPHRHEGSTTCCAVQALVSAENFGISIDKAVLERGFEYLRKCQNEDGGFDYKLGDTRSMKAGTAGGVATLGLMRKFDYEVMMKGYEYLLRIGPRAITKDRFPYYGHFYGLMGLRLLGQEFTPFQEKIDGYCGDALSDIGSWQRPDGSWHVRGWIAQHKQPDAYATSFASLIFAIGEGRLSIFNRDRPKLPVERVAVPKNLGN